MNKDELELHRVQKFIGYVVTTLNEASYSIRFEHREYLPGSNNFSGQLCDQKMALEVASGRPFYNWLGVLTHEFSHFLQFKDEAAGIPVKYSQVTYGADDWDIMLGKNSEYSDYQALKLIRSYQEMEADCDRRALKLIRKWKLPLNQELYCQQSNAYHLFYSYIAKHRTWYTCSPFTVPEILEKMPKKMLPWGKWKLTPELEQLFHDHAFDT